MKALQNKLSARWLHLSYASTRLSYMKPKINVDKYAINILNKIHQSSLTQNTEAVWSDQLNGRRLTDKQHQVLLNLIFEGLVQVLSQGVSCGHRSDRFLKELQDVRLIKLTPQAIALIESINKPGDEQ